MANRENLSVKDIEHAFIPAAYTTADHDGTTIDMQNADSVTLTIVSGNVAGNTGNFVFVVQESDTTTDGDFANAPASAVNSATNAVTFSPTEDNSAKSIAYIGSKRYIRLNLSTITTGGTPSGVFGAVAIKEHLNNAPID